ncbi:putative tuberous sclerosis 1 protein [Eutypa lata UCREL1]|uniref:Putative tuberous sclerosis 1 protein n=1 Tax=Eutypa lata (strain UCR-EL1) TaxID=1287681 RepID=M7TEY6_EUTLA|nr:putative tuberous sclerosis 1 protein [Eutypa lata UCREL1]
MSSAPTFKNLTKAIQAFIPTASLPLPQDLVEILEAYIQKHENKFDGNTADKANEELLSIFNRDIIQTPVRYAPFMAIIRRLRPLVVKADKIFQWFDLLLPVLDHINQEKGLAAECQGTMLDAMTADDELMALLDKFLVQKEYRARILILLAAFVKSQPPHLHLILQTPLFGFDDTTIPHLLSYFTILYGLYPINFVDYIRKPQRYLRHAEAPGSDDIEIQPSEMRHASERFRQCHLLHENFYTLTIDSEKTDFGRWIKSEPSEVVADCMALRLDLEPTLDHGIHGDVMPGASEFMTDETDADSGTSALLSSGDSPMLRKQISSSGSQTHLQDMLNSNKVIKSGLSQSLANDSVPSLALSHQESVPERPNSRLQQNLQVADSPQPGAESASDDQYASLYRQILLLQVDLTFERFMKQQHLTHMGELRRRQVREAASEAETQNLIIANRHLKQRFEEARKSELQVKKESERSHQKKWAIEETTLRTELESTRSEVDKLVQLVCDAEVRELGLKQNMQSVESSVGELEMLRNEVERLTESERNLQARETEHRAAMTRSTEAESRAEMLDLRLKAFETELRQVHDSYQSQIDILNAKLQDAAKNSPGPKYEDILSKLNSSLAIARTRQQDLKKRIATLTRDNTALQGTIMELQTKLPSRSRSDSHRPVIAIDAADHSTDSESQFAGGVRIPSRKHRGYSNPEPFIEATSYNATPPLEPVGLSSSYVQRSISPSGAETPPAGGLQNLRKDKKDKKEDKDKKEKKLAGMRGIRGYL